MTPQEKDLIQSVFDRLARTGVGQKDNEADALIRDNIRRLPDAPYGLVQAVITQEIGLNQASAKIAELQRQLDEARAQAPSGGGFLGGASPWGGGSVPRSGGVPAPAYAPQPAAAPPAYVQPPAYAPQPQQSGPWSQPAGGGFLRNAAMMAAGVAGGTLIAEGLSSMFGHHGGGFGGMGGLAGGSPWGGQPTEVVENVTTVNNYYDDRQGTGGDTRDASYQDASYDDSGDAGMDTGFDGGFDDSQDV